MVGVAQLVEHLVVVQEVAGSSPVTHPNLLQSATDVENGAMAASARAGAWAALIAYGLVSLLELVSQWLGLVLLGRAALSLLMPLLIIFLLLAAPRPTRLVRWVVLALVFCWFGDALGVTLLIKISFFLVAQICYLMAFWPLRHNGLWSRPVPLAGFLVALGVLIVWVGLQAGALAPAVLGYGAGLALMTVTATGVSRLSGIGATLFLISDVVLGLEFFVSPGSLPYALFVNMLLYLPGQALLVLGVLVHERTLV